MRIYGYLRASTEEQNAERARQALEIFSKEQGFEVSAWFVENASGAKLQRPELFRLLDVAERGDALLIEQVDRLSRLNKADWERLRNIINAKGLQIVAMDLPTSWKVADPGEDEFTGRFKQAMTAMLLDMLAAYSHKDYQDRRRRQAEGMARARLAGKYKGRQRDEELHEKIRMMLLDGWSYGKIQKVLGCGRNTISAVRKRFEIPLAQGAK